MLLSTLYALSKRFEELRIGRVVEDFKELQCSGDYKEYVDKFEELRDYLNTLHGQPVTEDYYIASFIGGLSPELEYVVRMMNPITLQQVIDLGRNH